MRSVPLALRRYGRGRPVVLLHGLFGSSVQWHHIAAPLAQGCEVLALDLRNHGASPHAQAMDYATLAADVCAVLDANGLADAAVLGHSMGGKVAMTLALHAPSRVRSLAVIDIAPVTYPGDFGPLIHAVLCLDLAAVQTRAQADALLARRIDSPALRSMLLQNLARSDGAWHWRIDWAAIGHNLPQLQAFAPAAAHARSPVPTLFVRGARSDYVRAEHQPAIDTRFADARVRTIAGAGHWVHADRPGELLRALRDWLV